MVIDCVSITKIKTISDNSRYLNCASVMLLFAIHMITLKLIPFLKLPLYLLALAEEEVRKRKKKNEAGDNRVNNLRAFRPLFP